MSFAPLRSPESSTRTHNRRPGQVEQHLRRRVSAALLPMLAISVIAAPASQIGASRATLEKWVETRQQISKNKTDWQNDKETLLSTIALFESEIESLEKLKTGVRTNSVSVLREYAQLTQEKEALVNASDRVRQLTEGFEMGILALTNALPQPLLVAIDQALRKIPAADTTTKTSVSERLGNVLGILNEIDKFNSMVTVEPEVQTDPAGASIQVVKIYLGLGQAYFVNEDETYAGVGIPSPSGWVWKTQNELAPAIARVRRQYEDLTPPAFVGLPIEIK